MITLQFRATKPNRFPLKIEEVLHLKVVDIQERPSGWWRLTVDDVTPLPGAVPDSYGCHICGIIDGAKPDGSLPEGWAERTFEEGSFFVCSEKICQEQRFCKVCGCTEEQACQTITGTCSWVEGDRIPGDLCSACLVLREMREMDKQGLPKC